ncbi:MAG TPA: indolepyruvate ferredoxin oxidoreductase subunit beta [Methanomicrobia archaeon]|nr:indolepyruvate ferredoxin oxidoreductase subunit beta [Methanomicrobia archaeon]
MNGRYNMVLSGVGGQGLMLLSNVIGTACAQEGLPVITGEQHGLSQRSGSISVHLRMGEGTYGPLVPPGDADVMIAMEATEALRYIEFLRDDGYIIMNTRVMHHPLETMRHVREDATTEPYFSLDELRKRVRNVTPNVLEVDALRLAEAAGTARAENVVLLGAACGLPGFPLKKETVKDVIGNVVPEKTIAANMKAFDAGDGACCDAFG